VQQFLTERGIMGDTNKTTVTESPPSTLGPPPLSVCLICCGGIASAAIIIGWYAIGAAFFAGPLLIGVARIINLLSQRK
jgi:hypothetical protein